MRIDIGNNSLTPDEKISIFRSFFRGREEVYPRRFENRKSGKMGYAPVCSNEWVRGICAKPKIKCSECPHRAFLPVTDDVIRWHLSGLDNRGNDFVMGVYPMLLDETCFSLAADFDKASWQEDALAFFKTCRQMNLPAAIERSRLAKEPMYGYFLKLQYQRHWHANLAPIFSLKPWNPGPILVLTPMIDSFQTKTPYPKADLEISSHCPCKRKPEV